ncbi:MAG TPA: mevalonate kinase [Bacteroidetes bacterium]|nr:mevalonate kinase [Bacteroidota bacterium]
MKMTSISDTVHAKILLFGEYTVLLGARGLTIPFSHFSGRLALPTGEQVTDLNFARRSHHDLAGYINWLDQSVVSGSLLPVLDLHRLQKDLGNGLYFESTIPPGYGLGSSGALVAALYRTYAIDPIIPGHRLPPGELSKLKTLFAGMESFFHGTSSGLDPLIGYTGVPLLTEQDGTVMPVALPQPGENAKGAFFLVNTGMPRKTAPLVDLFMERCRDKTYKQKIMKELLSLNDVCISHVMNGITEGFEREMEKLSAFQQEHFRPMIPGIFTEYWENGLDTGDFYLKLLGAGGGGYLLGYARDYSRAVIRWQELGLDPVPVYGIKK